MLVLDKLWNGEISPCERYCQKNSSAQEIKDKLSEKSQALDRAMSEEIKRLWEDYSAVRSRVEMLESENAYIEGVRFGVLLMLDVLCENDVNFLDGGKDNG